MSIKIAYGKSEDRIAQPGIEIPATVYKTLRLLRARSICKIIGKSAEKRRKKEKTDRRK